MTDKEAFDSPWRETIRATLETLPSDYRGKREAMKQLSRAFHEELGSSLQTTLATEVSRLENMSLNERREWASNFNEELRELHLTLRCPKTAFPATLSADSAGGETAQPRYRLQIYQRGRATKTYTGKGLPELTIMPDDTRIETLAHRGRGVGGRD